MKNKKFWFSRGTSMMILWTILFIPACMNDSGALSYSDLIGEWELVHAERNGIITTTFQKSIFTFSEDSVLTTNIPLLESVGKIDLKGNELLTDGNKMENVSLHKVDSTGDLQLRSDIAGFKFLFVLEKK